MLKFLLTTVETDCIQSKLALNYLYSVVADAPLETTVRTYLPGDSDEKIYDEILRGQYNIVYFHCDMLNESRITTLCEIVKKAMPASITVVGGMQVTFDTRAFMEEHQEVDYVFRGEGEPVLYEFIRTILTYDFDFESIPGLAYWDDDRICVNPIGIPIRFEDIPFPYERAELEEGDTAYYESFRGNPDKCFYSQFIPEEGVRTRSLNKVCTELRYFLYKNLEKVVFVDKWFNCNVERAYRIWEYIMENDNGVTCFSFDVNGYNIDDDTIRLLATAREGLFEFNVDVESTNPEPLAASGRKENIYQLMYNVSKLLKDTYVKVNVSQKIGMPYETYELFARAFNKIYELKADKITADVLRLRKGTVLRRNAEKFGYLYNSKPPYEVIASDHMSATDLLRIKMAIETAGTFMNGGFEASLRKIQNDTGIRPFQLFAKLGEFIYKNGYATKMGKPENLYRIMYAFTMFLYDEMGETLKLQVMEQVIYNDLIENLPEDKIAEFDATGWDFN